MTIREVVPFDLGIEQNLDLRGAGVNRTFGNSDYLVYGNTTDGSPNILSGLTYSRLLQRLTGFGLCMFCLWLCNSLVSVKLTEYSG